MEQVDLDECEREVTCIYRGETFRVRDNGAVLRCHKDGGRRRSRDERWTFGTKDEKNGYMFFVSGVRVHQIVATAFHGPKPGEGYVVDHIDTNRCNNRPENLRWVTRLDNILLNPTSLKRILFLYGSVEEFLANPANPKTGELHPDFGWMRTVTKEEAEACLKRFQEWAESDGMPSGGSLGEWVYETRAKGSAQKPKSETKRDYLTDSRTAGAIQRNWRTPCEFPRCPVEVRDNALTEYRDKLKDGGVFSRNDYGDSMAVEAELSESGESLLVMSSTASGIKPYALAQITVERQRFVHEALGTFFTDDGAKKQFTIKRGLPWEGGDSIDDYC